MKTIITTIPKAGTYLAREILVNAGLRCDTRHISQKRHWYQPLEIQEDADFRVGHVAPYKEIGPFRIVFIHRNLRDSLVSSLRFAMKCGHRKTAEITPEYLTHVLVKKEGSLGDPKMTNLMGWQRRRPIAPHMTLKFENLHKAHTVKRLVELVSGKPCDSYDAKLIVDASINKETRTWSGKRTRWQDHWDKTVEKHWRESKLFPFNVELGYETL